MGTIRFSLGALHTVDAQSKNQPLVALREKEHIHGELKVEVAGRAVPGLGFWGPNDVCIGEWMDQLAAVAKIFRSKDLDTHVFDEGEQGQPAYVFGRNGDHGFITIAHSELSGAEADPEWQHIVYSVADYLDEYGALCAALSERIKALPNEMGRTWSKYNRLDDLLPYLK